MKQIKRMVSLFTAAGACALLLAGCGASDEIDLFHGEPAIEYSRGQTESPADTHEQMLDVWQQMIEKTIKREPVMTEILEKLKEASGGVNDVGYRVEQTTVYLMVKISRDDKEAYNDVVTACTEEIEQLLQTIKEKGVDYPSAVIEYSSRGSTGSRSFDLG